MTVIHSLENWNLGPQSKSRKVLSLTLRGPSALTPLCSLYTTVPTSSPPNLFFLPTCQQQQLVIFSPVVVEPGATMQRMWDYFSHRISIK